MAELFANFAKSTLAAGISNADLSLAVSSGDGAKFPSPSGGDYFVGFLISADLTTHEAVKVTARTSDTLTIVRAFDGSSASAFSAGATVLAGASAELLTRFELAAAHAALAALGPTLHGY